MTAQQLKNSILQLAVQGKLVPQDSSDEPASVLLQRIKAEKQELIKAGKIKKDKKSSEIFRGASRNLPYAFCEQIGKEIKDISDEIPFEIPESWEWCRFGNAMINRDSERIPLSVAKRENLDKIYDYYGASGVIDKVDKYLFNKPLLLIGEDGANLLLRSKPIAFIARGEYWVNNHAHVLDTVGGLSMEYICVYINAINLSPYVTGTAQPKMNQEKMNSILVPIPPLSEQRKIVLKIEQLLPFIEKYEQAETQLTTLNTSFPEMLKKSILQEAVQGKLVPQNPDDEPASVLLERIRAEKQKLIKAGKIKKSKHESVIITRDKIPYEIVDGKERCIADDVPFEIPESWCWCRLSHLYSILNGDRGKNYPSKDKLKKHGIPFISAINLDGTKVVEDNKLLCVDETQYNLLNNGKLIKDDIVVCIRGSLGKHARCQLDRGAIASSLVIMRSYCHSNVFASYLMLYLDSPLFFTEIKKYDNGTVQPNLAAKCLEEFFIPLPPLAEQKRIVEKIEELIPMINSMSK